MENKIQVFNEQEVFGKDFRIYGDAENPLFLAKDVAEWIEHSNPRVMLQTVDENEKVVNNVYTLGGNQEAWFLTEDGLYEVLMQSRKPIAKEFKKEVKRILKQIRQTGGYIPVEKKETDEDTDIEIMSKALSIMQKTMRDKDKFIIEAKPKLEAYTVFLDTTGVYNFDIWAGSMNCGRNKLMEFLRKNKVLQKGNSNNIPYRRFIASGYFKVKFKPGYDGVVRPQTFITPIGAEYITKFCKKHGFAIGNEVA